MIRIKNSLLQNKKFVKFYLNEVGGKVQKKTVSRTDWINFPANSLFTAKKLNISKEFIDWILVDPFSPSHFADTSSVEFLAEYRAIKKYLMHGKVYYDFLNKMEYHKSHTDHNGTPMSAMTYLNSIRNAVINDFNAVIKFAIPSIAANNESIYYSWYDRIAKDFKLINDEINIFFKYSFISETLRFNLLDKMNVNVCPYCNRQWVDKYKISRQSSKSVSIAQLDHIYSQKKFPLFSLTLANFVPSCAHCNMVIKRDHMFPFNYPYSGKGNQDKVFAHVINRPEDFYGGSEVTISLVSGHSDLHQHDFFNLRHIYSNHAGFVAELLDKQKLRNESYRQHLTTIFERPWSDEEVDLLLFNTTGKEEDLLNKPLSKLTRDIIDL
ncbi:hypothetical protein GE278_09610 [Enterobacteriaceae bacterium Kacie_13]|nr:hypothetical protein GE278_09610 [Enterobacteriaceae bacterium Kacie_13]